MERKIGDTFNYEGTLIKVEESRNTGGCPDCIFHNQPCWEDNIRNLTGDCDEMYRKDGKNVIFVKNNHNDK